MKRFVLGWIFVIHSLAHASIGVWMTTQRGVRDRADRAMTVSGNS